MALPQDLKAVTKIRIRVQADKLQAKVSTSAPFEVLDDQGRIVVKGEKLDGATVKPVAKGIQWWSRIVPTRFLVVKSIGHGIRVGASGVYRDEVFIYKNDRGPWMLSIG